jgi:branched-chain amino acid transport system ATP-binding protein
MLALETRNLTKDFRGFRAVNGVSLRVEAGTVHALVGPNGAGKTTLFNMLTGMLKPSAGHILLFGHDITHLPPDQIARRGVARSFQITSLFNQLTAQEHVVLALQSATSLGYRFWSSDRVLAQLTDRAAALLGQVGLLDVAGRAAGSLPYGQKRALEVAVALALSPQLVLLDEPTAGMGIEDVQRTIDLIARVRADRTIVLVEHNMGVVGNLADRVTVLRYGQVLAEGVYAEVRANPDVIEAYLGKE